MQTVAFGPQLSTAINTMQNDRDFLCAKTAEIHNSNGKNVKEAKIVSVTANVSYLGELAEQSDKVCVAFAGGHVYGDGTVLAFLVDIGAMLQQQLDEFDVTVDGRIMKRCVGRHIGCVRLSPVFQQHLCQAIVGAKKNKTRISTNQLGGEKRDATEWTTIVALCWNSFIFEVKEKNS